MGKTRMKHKVYKNHYRILYWDPKTKTEFLSGLNFYSLKIARKVLKENNDAGCTSLIGLSVLKILDGEERIAYE